jgi:uncharacterized protein
MASESLDYERMAQDALRGVVREALKRVQRDGALPGKHHFYITFKTKHAGVDIADYLVEKYPDEMTIVLEHQFFDLDVSDRHFEVTLRFAGVPQHLYVPFGAITRFYFRSVRPAVRSRRRRARSAQARRQRSAGKRRRRFGCGS